MGYYEQLENQKDLFFIYTEDLMRALYEKGVAAHVAEHPDWLLSYFRDDDHIVRCIDEGAPGGVHVAGAGVLLDEEAAVELLKKTGGATSHDGCGAAGLYYQKYKESLEAASPGISADQHAKRRIEELCNLAGVPYHGHLAHTHMRRPREFHPARIAFYDATDKFNNLTITGAPEAALLPQGFVVSRAAHRVVEEALEEAAICVQIALGGHGFGQRITLEDPFLFVAIADPEHPDYSLETLMDELNHAEALRPWIMEGLVRVDGFVAPVPGDAPWLGRE